MLQWMQEIFNNFAQDLIQILPTSPIRPFLNQWTITTPNALKWLNWLVPVSGIITMFTAWISAYTVYLVCSIVMRWIKAIE